MTYLTFSHSHATIASTILTKKATPIDHKKLSISSTSPINMLTSFFLSSPYRKLKNQKRKQSVSTLSFSSSVSLSPPPFLQMNISMNEGEEGEEDEEEDVIEDDEEIFYCQYCLRLYDIADIITQLLSQSQNIETLIIDFNHRPFKMMTLTNICDDAIHYFFTQLVKHCIQFPSLKSLTIQYLPKLTSTSLSDGGHSFWYWLTHIISSPISLQLINVTSSFLQNEFIKMLMQWDLSSSLSSSSSHLLRSLTIDSIMLQWNTNKEMDDLPQLYLPSSLHSFILKDYHPLWFQEDIFSLLKQDCPHLKYLSISDSHQQHYYNWKQQLTSQQNNKDELTSKIVDGMTLLLNYCTDLENWSIRGLPHTFENDNLLKLNIIEMAFHSTFSHDIHHHRDHDIWECHLGQI
ncbi:unnamed protein product [Cunninghamella blakesleeana]